MAYTSIFNTKPKKENANSFCQRIVELLNNIYFCEDNYVDNNGKKMLNCMFKYCNLNTGYSNIDDLIKEKSVKYRNIFELCNSAEIDQEELLINIDIIANCLFTFKPKSNRHFWNPVKAEEIILLIFKCIDQYLLSLGYRLKSENNQLFIIENEIAIDVNKIDDDKIREEVINFYDYKNAKNLEEKEKILMLLFKKLESKKNKISTIMGNSIASTLNNYANNIHIRHDNKTSSYKKCYNEKINDLTDEELLNWYNYIFVFTLNIYLNLEKLKDININGGYK